MISSASSLMEAFIQREADLLRTMRMPHMPTLGSAYEEITKSAIDQDFVLPRNLDLRVVSGFISLFGQTCNGQIDCMLVYGDGKAYGLTGQYIYPIEQVLCVIEVKKTLHHADLRDALHHLATVRKNYSKHFDMRLRLGFRPLLASAQRMFAQITGHAAPEILDHIEKLPETQAMLFYDLVKESYAPLTIIHGYSGYKTETGLRTAFLDLFQEGIAGPDKWLSVPDLPSLITSNSFSLVKSNGLPFSVFSANRWVAVSSARHNAVRMILAALWSKIGQHFDLRMPFNNGLAEDRLYPLLLAKPRKLNGWVGWACSCIEAEERELLRKDDGRWVPCALGAAEIALVRLLWREFGCLEITPALHAHFATTHGTSLATVIGNLTNTREFMIEGMWLVPVARDVVLLAVTDEEGYVSSDVARFEEWCDSEKIPKRFLHVIAPE